MGAETPVDHSNGIVQLRQHITINETVSQLSSSNSTFHLAWEETNFIRHTAYI